MRSKPWHRWLACLPLLCALFYAPLAFGATTPATVQVLDLVLVAGFACWLLSLALQRRMPRLPWLCLGALAFLAAWGLCVYLNPVTEHDAETWEFRVVPGSIAWLPGSVAPDASTPVLRHLGALLLAFLALLDLASSPRTRWILLRATALAGFLVALIGIVQKASGADAMLWATPQQSGPYFFAAFRYHANAASFLLLGSFAALAVWLRTFSAAPSSVQNSVDAVVALFTFTALFVNTSKAGQVLVIAALVVVAIRFLPAFLSGRTSRVVATIAVLLVLAVIGVAILPSVTHSLDRWNELSADSASLEGRSATYQACLTAAREAGFLGNGPGTFRIVFPYYTHELADQIRGVWYHAHQDYLQALIEWGWLGFAGWIVLIGGGLVVALRRIVSHRRSGQMEISTSCSFLALLFVLAHALVDFPLQIPAIQLAFLVHLAIAWNGWNRTRKTPA